MRVACLQFAPQVGDVNNNLNRADAVLSKANPDDLDLLVLPELAFSGYNFKSLNDISPFLEPTGSGITSLWARTTALKHNCVVAAGYPEKVDVSKKWPTSPEYYNSLIVVNEDGETIANYRKTHLYYTDETWALEGQGFDSGHIPGVGNVALGICMDLNPYRFEAPWSTFEFAFHILDVGANVVIVSMAWLTREDPRSFSRMPKEPDMETLTYWVKRLEPLIRAEDDEEIIVIMANRTGAEDDAVYAGTSTVIGIQNGEVNVYGLLGRGEKELLVVDTSLPPLAKLVYRPDPLPNPNVNVNPHMSKNHEAPPASSESTSGKGEYSSRPASRASNRSVSQKSAPKSDDAQSSSGDNGHRILGGHVLITQETPTPSTATFSHPGTPYPGDMSPIESRYFWLRPDTLRTVVPAIPQSPTSSTRSNHSDSSDVRHGDLIKHRTTRGDCAAFSPVDEKMTAFTPIDEKVERSEKLSELMDTLRKATSGQSNHTPARPSSPKSRNASRSGRGERSDSVLGQRPPSALGNRAQNAVISSDAALARPESPKSRNASRNHSRTRILETPSLISDRQMSNVSRNQSRPAIPRHFSESDGKNQKPNTSDESVIDDTEIERHLSTSPDLEKIGADLLVFEEGPRRPRRDSLECHADEDDFIVFQSSQERRHSHTRGIGSPTWSIPKSPSKKRASSVPQTSPDLPGDPRAARRGRPINTSMSSPKIPPTERGDKRVEKRGATSQAKSSSRVQSPETIAENPKGLTERSTRRKQISSKAEPLSTRTIMLSDLSINMTLRDTSRESLDQSPKLYASSVMTAETTSTPATPESLPRTPKAMILTPDWENSGPNSAPLVEIIPLKCMEGDLDRPRSA